MPVVVQYNAGSRDTYKDTYRVRYSIEYCTGFVDICQDM